MEWTGIAIDLPWFASLKQRFQAEREAVEKRIYEAAGTEFNINSNPQLREILFEQAESSSTQANQHRSFDRRQCSDGARGAGARAADTAHGVPGAGEAREHLPGCPAATREPEDTTAAHVIQSDGGQHGAAVVKRSESSEHSDPTGAWARHPSWLHSTQRMAAARGGLFADRASAPRASIARIRRLSKHFRPVVTSIGRPQP